MQKQVKRSKLPGFNQDQLQGYITNLDRDVNNITTYANTLPFCSGTTGGTGSAGAGKLYVELSVKGVVYKVLIDGTV